MTQTHAELNTDGSPTDFWCLMSVFFSRYLSRDNTDAVHRFEPGVRPGDIRMSRRAERAPDTQSTPVSSSLQKHRPTQTDPQTHRPTLSTGDSLLLRPGPPSSRSPGRTGTRTRSSALLRSGAVGNPNTPHLLTLIPSSQDQSR